MRIWSVVLIFLIGATGFAEPLCGTYKVQVYVSEKDKGQKVFANPKAVSSTQISLKKPVPEEYWGRVVEIEVHFEKLCIGSCDVSEYKILKAVSPFEKLRAFNHDKKGLIKEKKCAPEI